MLLRATAERETTILVRTGLGVLVGLLVLAAALAGFRPLNRQAGVTAVLIDTPYVGQGVAADTPVVMFGTRVGEVATVAARDGGGTRLQLRLAAEPAAGLTDRFELDFRPANYFGVTGVNLTPGPAGGRALYDGMHLTVTPRGNHTMQSLLSRLSAITDGVVTPQLVSVVDRATRYVDGLNPLAETMLQVANTITAVQTVPTAHLLRNVAGIAVAAPTFVDGATDLADRLRNTGLDVDEDFFRDRFLATINLASTGLFGIVGTLSSSHVEDLLPLTRIVSALTGPVPGIAAAPDIAATLVELRSRFERMYEGADGQRALRVRIALDALPGVAAPLGIAAEAP